MTNIWVLDQDRALDLSTTKLGFVLGSDADMGNGVRWLTVAHPKQPGLSLLLVTPRPPMVPEDAATAMRRAIAAGTMGGGVMRCDDVRVTYEELRARGVEFVQAPEQRPYGVEALFRDDSGTCSASPSAERAAAPPPARRRAAGPAGLSGGSGTVAG